MASHRKSLLYPTKLISRIPCIIVAWTWLLVPPDVLTANESSTAIRQAQAGYEYTFPFDHGTHDQFLTEWWYFTGHLFTPDKRHVGYELTFFRRTINDERVQSNPSQWAIHQLYLAHFAITDEVNDHFLYAEKISRAGLGKAGAAKGKLETWIDQWSVKAIDDDHHQFRLQADMQDVSIDLVTHTTQPPIIHGNQGVSRKGSGSSHASHYYSFTRLKTTGSLRLKGTKYDVDGLSWMDHEFSSSDLEDGLVGWDWFSIQFESGHDLMIYWLRRADGTFALASSGTLVYPNGVTQHLTHKEINITVLDHWKSSKSGAHYPSQWEITIPRHQIQVHIIPRMADQELRTDRSTQITYWEGAVDASGTLGQTPMTGLGYVELTGYAEPYQPNQ